MYSIFSVLHWQRENLNTSESVVYLSLQDKWEKPTWNTNLTKSRFTYLNSDLASTSLKSCEIIWASVSTTVKECGLHRTTCLCRVKVSSDRSLKNIDCRDAMYPQNGNISSLSISALTILQGKKNKQFYETPNLINFKSLSSLLVSGLSDMSWSLIKRLSIQSLRHHQWNITFWKSSCLSTFTHLKFT